MVIIQKITSYIACIFGISGGGYDSSTESKAIDISFSFNEPHFKSTYYIGEKYEKIVMESLPVMNKPNEPTLPVKPVYICIYIITTRNQGTEVKEISVTTSNKISLGKGHKIAFESKFVPFSRKSYAFGNGRCTNGTFPNGFYKVIGVQNFRGYSILIVNLYPVHYIAKNGEIYYYDKMVLTVKLKKSFFINPLFGGLGQDKIMVMKRVENPSAVETYRKILP